MKLWIKRTLWGVAGTTLVLGGLTACGHGPRNDVDRMAAQGGPEMMGRPGMMHGWGPHGRRGEPPTEAEMARMREAMVERATRELALDAAQKGKLVTLLDTLHAQRLAVMGPPPQPPMPPVAASGAGKAPPAPPANPLTELIKGERFDRSRAQALVDEKSQAMNKAAPAVIAAFGDFYDGLKPEQQAKVRDFLARGPGRGMGRFGPGMGPMGPGAMMPPRG